MPAEYQLFPPDYQIQMESSLRSTTFRGPLVPIEGLGRVYIWGISRGTVWDEEKGITVIRNRVKRSSAGTLMDSGRFNINLYFYGIDARGPLDILSIATHTGAPELLLGSRFALDSHDPDEDINQKFSGTDNYWTEHEDPSPVYLFELPRADRLSRYRFSFQRVGG